MKKYSAIVFDLGNVLLSFDYQKIINNLEKIEKGLGEKFYSLYQQNYFIHRKFEKREIPTEDFIATMLGWVNHKMKADEFCKIYSEIFTTNDDVISLLPQLKKKYKLILLSNTNFIHQKYGWEKYEFLNIFDKLILSHEAGAIKPEEKIYRAVENFTKLPSAEHFFIDDVYEYVEGAKKIGWDAVQFTGYENLINEMKSRNIL